LKENGQTWLIVPAAGQGVRFGAPVPKQFVSFGDETLLQRTLRKLWSLELVDGMVVVVPEDKVAEREILPAELYDCDQVVLTEGGRRRSDSVEAGLGCLPEACALVLIHDGVRPQVSKELVERVLNGTRQVGACIPVLPATETVKEVDSSGRVVSTLDRTRLRMIQTPQGFLKQVLEDAFRWKTKNAAGLEFTDEAAMVEGSGQTVITVDGDPENKKVTWASDVKDVKIVVPRVGFGYDVHRLVPDRDLILGGVKVSFELGLLGHSDGDVLLHALCDALLGAAALGDIGQHFPDDDPSYKDADSMELLAQVRKKIQQAGWQVSSVDMTIIAERPKLKECLPEMANGIARILQIGTGAVGIKATTEEGLGITGSGQAISAQAVAVLVQEMETSR
jgi:2-C-methyl-D-erythritol 2,4-cyclodiphosphate synthase/2-C-methyl-D-erythritol 4-phosphate cytidylyltransferase